MASELIKAMLHPSEFASLIKFQFLGGKRRVFPPMDKSELTKSMKRCYELLEKTSRSFAAVIQALDPELRPAICLFYLVLRGLDTVEDDMTIPLGIKVPLLRDFYNRIEEPGWTFDGNDDKEKDKILMVEFDVVISEFLNLKSSYAEIIKDICKRMGNGMADFAEKMEVESKKDYDLYCHYVAGLVGIGLSKLFSASNLENAAIGNNVDRANSMGLFLQKTNIIRDYLEDLEDGRTWYPREIWSKHCDKLSDLRDPANRKQALNCLNEMVTDALGHIPDVFDYMAEIQNQTVFNFCAIPQVMAIATLAECYNNGALFEGVVKIRKGTAVSLMMEATNLNNVYEIFDRYLLTIKAEVNTILNPPKATVDALLRADNAIASARKAGAYTSIAQPNAGNQVVRISILIAASALMYKLLVEG